MTIEATRITVLRDEPPRPDGRYVHYWMQQAMRAEGNAALDYAIETANALKLPVVVSFGLTGWTSEPYPDANARHYVFLLQGLAEVERTLRQRGVGFTLRKGAPPDVTLAVAEEAAVLICDRGYLNPQRDWQDKVLARVACRVVMIETDAVVPIAVASAKHEFAARTLRPKVYRAWDEYLTAAPEPRPKVKADRLGFTSEIDLSDPAKAVAAMKIDHSVGAVARFAGGLAAARRNLDAFLNKGFQGYAEKRGEPSERAVSHLSPYLHFGMIGPVEIALKAREARTDHEDRASFLEELVVRRELAQNHCHYERRYATFASVPDWAKKTLAEQAGDERPYLYSRAELSESRTHDRYWNAAMTEMRETGYMHNRLRMYWGKKIVEWQPSPEEAFDTALWLNNRYFVDGRDANSFTNVGWLFGLHDRPWGRRPVFGTVRYMSENSLRKFDAAAYVRSVDELVAAEQT